MAASRTAGATVPEELKRQSERITEQLTQLNKILDTVTDHLNEMGTMMENYSPDLVKQVTSLSGSLTAYKGKAANIYSEVSQSLATYATGLIQNLENLSSNVEGIGTAIENL